MHNVHLYGDLANKYGSLHRFNIHHAPQAISALKANYPAFTEDFLKHDYQVILGDKEKGTYLEQKTLGIQIGNNKDVHIIPVVKGAKHNTGNAKVIIGLALMAPFAWELYGLFAAGGLEFLSASELAGMAFTDTAFSVGGMGVSYGSMALLGASMLLGGISQLVTNAPQAARKEQSFIFGGQVNKTQNGSAVPICYGQFRVGSVVGSAGLTIEQLLL